MMKCMVRQIAKTLVKRVCVVESKKGMSRRLIRWRYSVKEKTVCLKSSFACYSPAFFGQNEL